MDVYSEPALMASHWPKWGVVRAFWGRKGDRFHRENSREMPAALRSPRNALLGCSTTRLPVRL
jgi:hypothetical protein